jgi:hypothetical protein
MNTRQSSPSSAAPGIPAITARAHPDPVSGARFTTSDVTTYLQHQAPLRDSSGVPGTVAQVLFLTSAQVSILLDGAETGRTDSDMLCYVELHGAFTRSTLPGARTRHQAPLAQTAILVFDAQTGNLLVAGLR